MNQIVVFYNPFLPELKISVNGKKLSPYSALMRYQHQRIETWSNSLFSELYREVNSDYEVLCVSTDFACEWLNELAQRNPHCLAFSSQPLPLNSTVYDRLGKLELLGCEEEANRIVVPIINASGDQAMTAAVYEILKEQGIFEDISEDGITWSECPLTTIELQTCRFNDEIPYDASLIIALCSKEDDDVRVDTDLPVYALVMGTETRFIKRQSGKTFFYVDPDDLGKIILDILEEEALCPLVSQLGYNFSADAIALLTEHEKEDLTLICQAAPVCHVSIPKVLDLGRSMELKPRFFPSDSGIALRIISDQPSVVDSVDGVLQPHSLGTAEISVFAGDDPYPVATEIVEVCQRSLITDITLFPSVLCMPVGGSSQLDVTVIPPDAENQDEIRWESSNPSVAEVERSTGVITAKTCGRCTITAFTQEASGYITLNVQPEMEDIICPCSFMELGAREQKEWRYKVYPENAYGADSLQVLSTDKNIAEYRGGYVLGKSTGTCKIYIRNQSGTINRELRVTVKKGKSFGNRMI